MDVVLISPKDLSLRQAPRTFRENNTRSDLEVLTGGPVNQIFFRRYRENLGIASLAAYLRRAGHQVRIINCNIETIDTVDIVRLAADNRPLLIGISLLYDLHVLHAGEIVRALRQAGVHSHITLGGPFASFAAESLLAAFPEVDSIIRGEGEIPLAQLVDALGGVREWRNLRGLAWRRPGAREIVHNPPGDIAELGALPFAARDYLEGLRERGIPTRVASMYSSRGCLGRCTYCTAPASAKLVELALRWRYRPAEHLLDEIGMLIKDFGVEYLYFNDDNFMGYGFEAKARLEAVAQGIIARGYQIRFHGECRVDSTAFLDPQFLRLMKRAGFQDVLLGLESGSQATLNRWRKGTTVERNRKAVVLLTDLGFDVEPAMILVDAKTTLPDLDATVDFIDDVGLHHLGNPLYLFNRLVVFPGAPVEAEYLRAGLIERPDPWDVPDLNDPRAFFAHMQKLSYRPYAVQDMRVRIMWDALVRQSDRLTEIVDERIPAVLKAWRRWLSAPGSADAKRAGRVSHLKFVSQIRAWRTALEDTVLNLLRRALSIAKECDPAWGGLPEYYDSELSAVVRQTGERAQVESIEDYLDAEMARLMRIKEEVRPVGGGVKCG